MTELTPWQRRRLEQGDGSYHPVIESATATEQRGGRLPHEERVLTVIEAVEPTTGELVDATIARALHRPAYPVTESSPAWHHLLAVPYVLAVAVWFAGYLIAFFAGALWDAFLDVADV